MAVVVEEEAAAAEAPPMARAALKLNKTKKINRSTEEQSINNACIASSERRLQRPKSTTITI